MLKKLNGNITKSLFYIKNNFLSILFKLCVIITMSILVYLVCILKKTDTANVGEYIDEFTVENYQKLMLTTEIPSDSDSPPSTTDALTTNGNFISNPDDIFGTHSLFPLQEQTTAQVGSDQTTTPCHDLETPAETSIDPNPKPTISFKRSLSLDELLMWETTTGASSKETILQPEEQIEEEEEGLFISVLTSTTINSPDEILDSTTVSPTPTADFPSTDDLFMDNWSNYITTEQDDSQIHPQEDTSSTQINDSVEPAESIFLTEDNDFGPLEAPIQENESAETSDIHSEEHIPHSAEDIKPSQDEFKNKGFADNKLFPLELPPIFAPNHLFNLFSLDHLPATSNMKPRWWSRSKNSPTVEGAPARSRKRHANSILPIDDPEEVPTDYQRMNQFRGLNALLNTKLKDSVYFLQRLLANFHQ